MADQDIKEILDIDVKEPPKTPQLTKEAIIGSLKVQEFGCTLIRNIYVHVHVHHGILMSYYFFLKKTKKTTDVGLRRPSGMNREVYALLYSDNRYIVYSRVC